MGIQSHHTNSTIVAKATIDDTDEGDNVLENPEIINGHVGTLAFARSMIAATSAIKSFLSLFAVTLLYGMCLTLVTSATHRRKNYTHIVQKV